MGLTKRQMMFLPVVNPKSFVLFFEKGDPGLSWSIHDYSNNGPPKRYTRKDFRWTADEVHQKAKYSFDAPTVDTNEFDYWHELTCEYNKKYPNTTGSNSSSATEVKDRQTGATPRDIIDRLFQHSGSDIYTQAQLAQRASAHRRKIEKAGVSAASVSRIYGGKTPVGRSIREAVASVINPVVLCTANDLLPSESKRPKRRESE